MRKAIYASLLTTGISSLISSPVYAEDDWSLNNHVSFLGEFVYLRRTRIHSHELVKDSNKPQCPTQCPDFEAIKTKDLVRRFDYEPGFRLGISYLIDEHRTLEARYMQVREWEDKKRVHGNASLSLPFDNPNFAFDYSSASEAEAEYRSKLWDGEFNYWRHLTPRRIDYFSVSLLAGFRYIQIKEHFKLTFFKNLLGGSFVDESHYRIFTKNYLYGFQVGPNLQWNPVVNLSWDATVKVGIMGNDATQGTRLGDINDTVELRHFESHEWYPTWLAEAMLSGGYQFTRHLNMHVGYQFLYLSGVALAPEQLDKSGMRERVFLKGDPMYHGLFLGMILSF